VGMQKQNSNPAIAVLNNEIDEENDEVSMYGRDEIRLVWNFNNRNNNNNNNNNEEEFLYYFD
jgi:hypothetical protein